MQKDNVFKSSQFHMDAGDVLHMLFLDESGTTVTVDLQGDNSPLIVPGRVTVSDATNITSSSFTANWTFTENTTGYYLDVASDSAFTTLVIDNHDAGNATSHAVTGLTSGMVYYYRIRAYNAIGTSISSETIKTTTSLESVTDADGNAYTYVTIGTQQWLVENLKTTKYNDGVAILNLQTDVDFLTDANGSKAGGYMVYNNDGLQATYGLLYSWFVIPNVHGIAPTGWRVATKTDFEGLRTYYGETVVNNAIRETGIVHWENPNDNANNISGLTTLPTGVRNVQFSGVWYNPQWESRNNGLNVYGDWIPQLCAYWLDEQSSPYAYYVVISHGQVSGYDDFIALIYETKECGMAIKCVRDI